MTEDLKEEFLQVDLDDTYYVQCDAYNFKLQRRIFKDDGSDTGNHLTVGFYSNLSSCLGAYADVLTRSSEGVATVDRLLNALNKIAEIVNDAKLKLITAWGNK